MQNALKEDLNEPVKIVQAHTFNLRTICIIVKLWETTGIALENNQRVRLYYISALKTKGLFSLA